MLTRSVSIENKRWKKMKIFSAFLTVYGVLAAQSAQAPNPTQQSIPVNTGAPMPIYRVTVVARTMKAINYNHRSGATKIDFRGTALLPKAHGEAKVESKQGYIEIEVEFRELQPATAYGAEYLTYVMWAITPEGRATNLGEVLLNGTNSKLNVNPSLIKPVRLDKQTPLELYEARNAVQIARWTGAEKYAADTFLKATQGLQNAEGYLKGKGGKKPIGTVAREAVQMAEDARIITIKKMQEESLANERAAGAQREQRAETQRAAAQSETDRVKRDAETARAAAQSETDRLKRDAEAARA